MGTSNYNFPLISGAASVKVPRDMNTLANAIDTSMNEDRVSANLRFEQTDLVEWLRRYAQFDKMQLKKVDTNNSIEISVLNKDRHVTFSFLNLLFDDYITQSYVYTGSFVPFAQAYTTKVWADFTRTGTWINATDTINGYTTQVGATWEATVAIKKDGDGIILAHNANAQGGMWRVTVNDNPDSAMDISAWNATSTKRKTLLGYFAKGTYVVKGTFTGDDPAHVPSNGAGTGRGWLNTTSYATLQAGEIFGEISKDVTLNTPSNKDFAINLKAQGGTTQQLIPYHGQPTAFNVEPPVYLDGTTPINLTGMANGAYLTIQSFVLKQHIYGRNPESGSTNLIEMWTNQAVTRQGLYQVDGKMKVLQPVTINNSYVIMGVAKGDLFDSILTSFGNLYPSTPSMYGQSTKLPERDWGKSYAFTSSSNDSIAIAYRFNNIRDTLRQNQSGKDTNPLDMTYIQHRDTNITKIYSRLWNTANLSPGYTLRFSGDYIYSIAPGIGKILS